MSKYEKDEDNELSSSSSSSSTANTGTSSRALVAKNSKDILFPTGVIVGIKNRSNSKIIASVTENYCMFLVFFYSYICTFFLLFFIINPLYFYDYLIDKSLDEG
jgi:hypothetical protein